MFRPLRTGSNRPRPPLALVRVIIVVAAAVAMMLTTLIYTRPGVHPSNVRPSHLHARPSTLTLHYPFSRLSYPSLPHHHTCMQIHRHTQLHKETHAYTALSTWIPRSKSARHTRPPCCMLGIDSGMAARGCEWVSERVSY